MAYDDLMIKENQHPRRLVYLDLENLTGSSSPSASECRVTVTWLKSHLGLLPEDQVVVAGDTHNALSVGEASRILHCTMRLGRGKDGADLALLREAYATPVAVLDSRYAPVLEVIIGSGDRIFTPLAQYFRQLGLNVIVVSLRHHLSYKLARASSNVIYLDNLDAV